MAENTNRFARVSRASARRPSRFSPERGPEAEMPAGPSSGSEQNLTSGETGKTRLSHVTAAITLSGAG